MAKGITAEEIGAIKRVFEDGKVTWSELPVLLNSMGNLFILVAQVVGILKTMGIKIGGK